MKKFAGRLLTKGQVSIDPHGRLLVGGLLPALLSGSEFWRLGVAVMAAIAAEAKSPVLVVDGADILDDRNKVKLIKWLLAEICPEVSPIPYFYPLLAASAGTRRRLLFNATKWWMEDGELSKASSQFAGPRPRMRQGPHTLV